MPHKNDQEKFFLTCSELYEDWKKWTKKYPSLVNMFGIDYSEAFFPCMTREILSVRDKKSETNSNNA